MTRYAETWLDAGRYPLRRRDRAAMVLAYGVLHERGWADVTLNRACTVLGNFGGAVSTSIAYSVPSHLRVSHGRHFRARLALLLRVLLRVDAWLATGNSTGDDLSPWDVTSLPPGHPFSCADETWEPYQTRIAGAWYRRLKAAPLWEAM